MRLQHSERKLHRPRAKELVEAAPENQPLRVEELVPPEVWTKIKECIPNTLKFSVQSFEQAFEATMFFCIAFPAQCKDLNLLPRVEKNLRKQLRIFKIKGDKSLWMNLLICARSLYPEKKLEYSVQHLWPELLKENHSGQARALLLMLVPELRHEFVTAEWVKKEKEMLADPDLFNETLQNILLLFSPEFREEIRNRSRKKTLQEVLKDRIRELKNSAQDPGREALFLQTFMKFLVFTKLVMAQDIVFAGDTVVIKETPRPLATQPTLPERVRI